MIVGLIFTSSSYWSCQRSTMRLVWLVRKTSHQAMSLRAISRPISVLRLMVMPSLLAL